MSPSASWDGCIAQLDRDGNFIDDARRVSGPLVHAHDSLLVRTGREAECLATLRIQPGMALAHPFVCLDRQVTAMCLVELLLGDSNESVVNVHVRWHQMLLCAAVSDVDHRRTRHLGGRFHYWREGAGGP